MSSNDDTRAESSHPATLPKLPRRRRYRWLGAGMAIALITVGAWFLIVDEPPPDDADLLLPPIPHVAAADSVWIGLMELRTLISEVPPKGTWRMEYASVWKPQSLDNSTQIRELEERLAAYFDGPGRAIGGIEEILARSSLGTATDDPLDTAVGFREVGDALNLLLDRALLARLRGDADACAADLLLLREAGEKLALEGKNLLEALVGLTYVQQSWNAIDSLLYDSVSSRGWEEEWLRHETLHERHPGIFARVMRREYEYTSAALDQMQDSSFMALLKFKKNRTQRLVGEEYRALIARSAQPPSKRGAPPLPPTARALQRDALLHRNAGEWLIPHLAGAFEGALKSYDQSVLIERAGRTELALRIYERTHGAFPPDLETLVAAIDGLDAVPLDPYSGRALGYDRDLRIIYSVGADLVDQKGVCWPQLLAGKQDRFQHPDAVWLIPKVSE